MEGACEVTDQHRRTLRALLERAESLRSLARQLADDADAESALLRESLEGDGEERLESVEGAAEHLRIAQEQLGGACGGLEEALA